MWSTQMKKQKLIKSLSVIMACVMVFSLQASVLNVQGATAVDNTSYPQNQAVQTETSSDIGYSDYISKYKNKVSGYQSISLSANQYSAAENVSLETEFKGKTEPVLVTDSSGFAEWKISVTQAGLYTVGVEYCTLDQEAESIQRSFLIDGQIPFKEAEDIEFSRAFKDETEVVHLEGEDDVRPSQIEVNEWLSTYLSDRMGYFGASLKFYLTEGEHTIRLSSVSGKMAIANITLVTGGNDQKDYKSVLKDYEKQGIKSVKNVLKDGVLIVQAEDATLKSDVALFPANDNSSGGNQPFDVVTRKINTVGGTRWQTTGQWLTWEVDVPESGLYEIGFRSRQDYVLDIDSIRSIYIDDAIQFQESEALAFSYKKGFTVSVASAKDGTPYLFYLEKGKRTIRIEASLGKFSESIRELSEALSKLSSANWNLLTLLGNDPDPYRDYNIDKYMPEVLETFEKQKKVLNKIVKELKGADGKEDANVAQINQLVYKLEEMLDDPAAIPGMFTTFRDNVSTMANTVMNMKNMPLTLDYIFIAEKDAELPEANPNFFVSFGIAIKKFFISFFKDYNNFSAAGNKSDKKPIKVWIGSGALSGRDQAMILNQMLKQDFIPKTGINVNLQLVPAGTLLTATVAGRGPDVSLQEGGSDPVNYAMRNAVVDLSKLDGFNEVSKRFPEGIFVTYTYQDGIYALPETFGFPMMFYRTDVLENMGINIDEVETWDDLFALLPVLQINNMQISLAAFTTSYYTMLFQNGGRLYKDNDIHSALDDKIALDTFNTFMGLYTNYGLPYSYNFVNRFRTGEIPIGIEDYAIYNILKLSAPEISGQWAMRDIPGTIDSQGNLNKTTVMNSSVAVILSASDNIDDSWEFLKWWTSADSQYKFGKEVESVMGTGARYNTANLEALNRLPWTKDEKENLFAQIEHLCGLPQVPGGYLTDRSVVFAISKVYTTAKDARKTLLGYVDDINQEIKHKRKEFDLDY